MRPRSDIGRAIVEITRALDLIEGTDRCSGDELALMREWMKNARCFLRCVDGADVAKWLDNEHCGQCGRCDVAIISDDGDPICARCATAQSPEAIALLERDDAEKEESRREA